MEEREHRGARDREREVESIQMFGRERGWDKQVTNEIENGREGEMKKSGRWNLESFCDVGYLGDVSKSYNKGRIYELISMRMM